MTEPERVLQQARAVTESAGETAGPAGRQPVAQTLLWLQATAGNQAVAAHLSVQRSPQDDLIDEHTSWYGNLDEDELGQALLARALRGEYAFVQATISELRSGNRDDVGLGFMAAASAPQLMTIAASEPGRRLLDRLLDELTEGSAGDDEQAQAERILRVKSQAIGSAQAQQQMLDGKVFPFRPGGITVWDDAPIMAERREGGQIWVKQPVRVGGTKMFAEETRTLPRDVFIGGALLPENEIVGVKFYDLGGEVVYRPALFLVQISNQNDTATLMKIAEIAGIGLTLGTGALVGLGVEASMAARVLLWADRAAFVLGAVTTVINEHRGEIIELFGDSGRDFLHYVDIVHSATAIYGFARVAIGMVKVINGLRQSLGNWRASAGTMTGELDDDELKMVQQISQQTDEVLKTADDVAGSARQPTAEPATIPPERQLGPGKPLTPQERLAPRRAQEAAARAAKEAQETLSKVRKEIERIDRELAAGTHNRHISKEDIDWLNENPVRKEIAYDNALRSYRVDEAKQAYAAEKAGLIPGPLSRPAGLDADVVDGAGVPWSIKGTGTKPDVDWTVGKIVGEVKKKMRCIADLREMSMKEQAAVRTIVIDKLKGTSHPEIRFLPLGVERIPAQ